jgi:hypothetical protein
MHWGKIALLVSWKFSAGDQRSRTFFGVMGTLVCLPNSLTMSNGPEWLTSGPSPLGSEWGGRQPGW